MSCWKVSVLFNLRDNVVLLNLHATAMGVKLMVRVSVYVVLPVAVSGAHKLVVLLNLRENVVLLNLRATT